MQVLAAKNLSKVYGSKKNKRYMALKNISFDIQPGDFIGVMGPSGSGKTTLLNILGSIDIPTTGKLLVSGTDIASLSRKALARHRIQHVGFIFQDFNLLESMTIEENIVLPLMISGEKPDEIAKRLKRLTEDLGISALLDKYPYEISGGEKQRAAACRALITNPSIILADEPTGNLDSKSGRQLLKLLEQINQSYDATILMVTHDANAASHCHSVMFIKDGEIYNRLHAEGDKKAFYEEILNVMRTFGGEN
ncbi:MAG: ABC transporter ATP-binding protein [Eubacteriales bacterium]